MQLKGGGPRGSDRKARHKKVAASLAAATCSLLGLAQPPTVEAKEAKPKKWRFDTALQFYGENDDRVQDTSFNFLARKTYGRERLLSFKLAVDSLTGASPNGAVPANDAQTFTSPSGGRGYTTPAGEIPLDSTFLDTRIALNGDWARPAGRFGRVSLGASVSNEYDYLHAGVNGRYSRDFNQRNTTLSLGLAIAGDSVEPVGGTPDPLSVMPAPDDDTDSDSAYRGDESKTVTDLVVGVTQVFGKRTLAQFNYSFSHASGYLTDPYKLLSVVDPVTGDPTPGPSPDVYLYRFESRPDTRTKHSLYAQVRRHLSRDILDASYRFMTDDWGIQSHTVDFRYRFKLGRHYLQPHARYYVQSAADFYYRTLFDGDPTPEHASADRRLGELDAYTLGLKYGHPYGNGKEWSVRLEYYSQSGRAPPESQVGSLRQFDLVPTVDALIGQIGFRF
ncbi:MAG: DUF3570 domain-containing protein [bacterium]|nr:DUF3570 domain-containing protein [bacterium]